MRLAAVLTMAALSAALTMQAGSSAASPARLDDLSPRSDSSLFADLAVNEAGDGVAAWQLDSTIQLSTRSGAGRWTSAFTLPLHARGFVDVPHAVIDPAGDATTVWTHHWGTDDESHSSVYAVSHPDGGRWADPVLLARGPSLQVVSVAVGDAGDLVVVWSDASTPHVLRQYVERRTPDGLWSEPHLFVSDGDGGGACTSVVVDRRGTATLVYNDAAGFDSSRLLAIRQSRDGSWSRPELLAQGARLSDCVSDVDTDGRVAVAWAEYRPGGVSRPTVVQATRWNGRSWKRATDLSALDGFNTPDLVHIDRSGTTTVVWHDSSVGTASMASRPLGGGWSPVENIPAPAGTSMFGNAAVDDAGDVAVAWSAHLDAWLVRRHAGSTTWSAPTLVSDHRDVADLPQVALDGRGGATMVWEWVARDSPPGHGFRVVQTTRLPFVPPDLERARLAHAGTRLLLRLSEDARVTLTWRRTGSDVAAASRKLWLDAGRSVVPLRARVAGKALVPGTYVLEVEARNVMGNAVPKRLALRITR